MKEFLVFTWGSPWYDYYKEGEDRYSWKEVQYYFVGEDLKEKSRTTLPAFLARIERQNQDNEDPRIVILALDTVYSKFLKELDDLNSLKRYEDLKERLKEKYEEFLGEVLENAGFSEWKDRISILIAPGVGRFLEKNYHRAINVVGAISDYYNFALYFLGLELLKTVEGMDPEEDLKITLDTTHGINFMPLLTRSALLQLAGMLSLTFPKVSLETYNSEPVSPATLTESKGKTFEIGIHLVDEHSPPPFQIPSKRLENKILRPFLPRSPEEEVKNLNEKFKEVREEFNINAFLASIINGLPLMIKNLAFDPSELEKTLKDAVETFYKGIELTGEDNSSGFPELKVMRNVRFDVDFSKFFNAYFIDKILKIDRGNEATIKELKEILERIKRANYTAYLLGKSELSKIQSKAYNAFKGGKIKKGKEISLQALFKRNPSKSGESDQGNDRRNFLAHAGLLKQYTLVRVESESEDGIFLKYKEDSLKILKELAEGSLDRSQRA